jgi:hypothetical protein
MIRASDKLAILSAEAPIHQPLMTDGGAFHQLEEEFRHRVRMTRDRHAAQHADQVSRNCWRTIMSAWW